MADKYNGSPELYKMFYAGEQDEEAYAFQKKTGWHMIWGSDYQGLNGDTWVVYRDVSDLPKWLQKFAKEEEVRLSERSAQTQEATEEKLVDIFDLEYDGEGYMHFHVMADGYALEGLYRLYDPANGPDMTLVSIDYGYLHPIIERQWDRIETALYDACLNRYHDILDKSEAFKETVIAAMEAAGYTYDVLESHEGWESFYGEGGARLGFDRLREAFEWLEGVVFDDPEISREVEKILHPERQTAQEVFVDVLDDAYARANEASSGAVCRTVEFEKD